MASSSNAPRSSARTQLFSSPARPCATAIVPRIYDPGVPDRTEFVTTEEAEDVVRRLAQDAGLLLGWSAGAAVVAAARLLSDRPTVRPSDAVVVVIAPDSGTRYLSEQRR